MEFNELIADFAERHGVEDLTAADNAAALDIDGIIVLIVSKGDMLTISAEIGEPPADGAAAFANVLLEANLQTDAFFAKAAEADMYVLVRRLALPTLDPVAFDGAVEGIVNLAEVWRKMLEDFRPAAKAAAQKAEAERPAFGSSDFVQV
jgi:hypothetical protein